MRRLLALVLSFPWLALAMTALVFGTLQYGTVVWRDVVLSSLILPLCIWVIGGCNRTSVGRFWLRVTIFTVLCAAQIALSQGWRWRFLFYMVASSSGIALLFAVLRPGHILAMRLRR